MAKVACVEGRKRLDKTLASPALAEKDNVRRLVKEQILKSSLHDRAGEDAGGNLDMKNNVETLVEKRSYEIWDTLEMLRSASDYSTEESKSRGWKLKQDTGQLRVMYREGPEGTLFHTLLAEGYINGPLDSCLCVGVESALYPHWWPQFTLPPFKVMESCCLKRIRIGEELSLVRMKVPWPFSTREVVFQYFELEYFEEDIIIVLLKSVSDSQKDNSIYGFRSEDIPPIEGTVRMDLMGGFALQKVDSTQSYFRTIANLDMKMDFVPPSFINFVSRQLIGHGFKLYQKTVLAASNVDENFQKIIEDGPMYIRIRAGLQANEETRGGKMKFVAEQDIEKSHSFSIDVVKNSDQTEESKLKGKVASKHSHEMATSNGASTSRVESVLSNGMEKNQYKTYPIPKQDLECPEIDNIHQACTEGHMSHVDPEVKKALNVLDSVIAFVRTYRPGAESLNQPTNPIITSEPQLPRLGFKGLSDSLPDELCNGSNDSSFLLGCKESQKLDEIESNSGLVRNHSKQGIHKNLANKINKIEDHVPRTANVRSKKHTCFRFLCFSK